MDEFINKEAIRNALYEADAITMNGVAIINQFHAADVKPVVLCKDCKHWETEWDTKYENGEHFCCEVDWHTSPDWYCANGERRE